MKSGSVTATVLAALVAGAVLSTVPASADSTDAEPSDQKIYLDPQTGDVLEAPRAEADAKPSSAGTADRRSAPGKPSVWTNDDGDEMLTPAPDDAPAMQAVRCADGTLRMGHADHAPGEDERHALCAGAPQ